MQASPAVTSARNRRAHVALLQLLLEQPDSPACPRVSYIPIHPDTPNLLHHVAIIICHTVLATAFGTSYIPPPSPPLHQTERNKQTTRGRARRRHWWGSIPPPHIHRVRLHPPPSRPTIRRAHAHAPGTIYRQPNLGPREPHERRHPIAPQPPRPRAPAHDPRRAPDEPPGHGDPVPQHAGATPTGVHRGR
ncbi:hypothetical protein C8R47DRAFT_1106950 [Mycena vitilis]|nr:hypothetical protein C8R47DRAFT_1106950 [Mycena vitilis]